MKTTFILFWLTIFPFLGQAQTNIYYPFPTSNTVWRGWNGGAYCDHCTDYQDFITGDTIIGSRNYYNIQRTGVYYYVDYNGICTNEIWIPYNYYNGAFRNDSVNKKVYYVPPSSTTDTLLYNFNLNLHDTLPPTYINSIVMSGVLYVDSIDSILIELKYHKEFVIKSYTLPNQSPFYLIEGIGSTIGLLSPIYTIVPCQYDLLCVQHNGSTIYPDSTYLCQIVDRIPAIGNPKFLFNIFPNPIPGRGVVNFSPPLLTIDLSITNILGVEIVRINGLKDGENIDLSNFQDGFYLYKVIHGSSIISTGKLILTK